VVLGSWVFLMCKAPLQVGHFPKLTPFLKLTNTNSFAAVLVYQALVRRTPLFGPVEVPYRGTSLIRDRPPP